MTEQCNIAQVWQNEWYCLDFNFFGLTETFSRYGRLHTMPEITIINVKGNDISTEF